MLLLVYHKNYLLIQMQILLLRVYRDWEGKDGVAYWLDADNVVYVVGNNRVITTYEIDFKFSRDINRLIVFQQVEVIKEVAGKLDVSEGKLKEMLDSVDYELTCITQEVEVAAATLAHLNAKKQELIARKDSAGKMVKVQQEQLELELGKLFKKWEVKAV